MQRARWLGGNAGAFESFFQSFACSKRLNSRVGRNTRARCTGEKHEMRRRVGLAEKNRWLKRSATRERLVASGCVCGECGCERRRLEPRRKAFEFLFDPSLSMIVVLSREFVCSHQEAASNDTIHHMDDCNFIRRKRFDSRNTSHNSALRVTPWFADKKVLRLPFWRINTPGKYVCPQASYTQFFTLLWSLLPTWRPKG